VRAMTGIEVAFLLTVAFVVFAACAVWLGLR
jgi:hypothetical protein